MELATANATASRTPLWRSAALPAFAALAVLAAAFVAGFMIRGTGGAATAGVLNLSARSSNFLGDIGAWLPLGFAFAAGMVTTVNPCGFVMLPAYLGLYVGTDDGGPRMSTGQRLARALVVSAALGLGFVLLFGGVGIALSAGAISITRWFPWIGLGVGVLLTILGAYVLAGGKLYSSLASNTAGRIGDPRDATLRGYFLFGVSYAVASLSCTLPVFLALVVSSVATGGIIYATAQFLVYALGMTFVITVLTLAIALFRGALVTTMRRSMRYVQPVSALLLLAAGGYIVFYWLTEGGLANRIAG